MLAVGQPQDSVLAVWAESMAVQVWWPQDWSYMCSSGPLGTKLSALECLEGMASGLYSELFTLLISLVNR